MRVLLAPDKFKGTLTAHEVASALAAGLASSDVESIALPLADGGDGSVAAAVAAGFAARRVVVRGADGRETAGCYADDGHTAVVEVANTCGLATLRAGRPAPMTASSHGFGEAVRSAVASGVRRVVLALGGSASTDGGTGLLTALGARFLDLAGEELAPGGGSLGSVAAVDTSGLVDLSAIELVVATDVENPLLGATGAAPVFGPQKGAGPAQVRRLETGLARLVQVLGELPPGPGGRSAPELAAEPGAGAAGGLGFACRWLGATRVAGADFFLDLLDFDTAVRSCDAVVTGEGRLDRQSLSGKLPGVVARRSRGRPVHLVVGSAELDDEGLTDLGATSVTTLRDRTLLAPDRDPALSLSLLRDIGAELGRRLAPGGPFGHRAATAPAPGRG